VISSEPSFQAQEKKCTDILGGEQLLRGVFLEGNNGEKNHQRCIRTKDNQKKTKENLDPVISQRGGKRRRGRASYDKGLPRWGGSNHLTSSKGLGGEKDFGYT